MTKMGEPIIALLGQPNSGKSTLFNVLTGSHQHVGNWPGKTVEKKEGTFVHNKKNFIVTDLPGTYSLSANSDEEIITRDYIASGIADVVCILADASQLERSLYMLADFAGIETPAFLLLNMIDVAEKQGKKININVIEQKLKIPVIPFSAPRQNSYEAFYEALEKALTEKPILDTSSLQKGLESISNFNEILSLIPSGIILKYSPLWLATKSIEKDKKVIARVQEFQSEKQANDFNLLVNSINDGALKTGECKFTWIDSILKDSFIFKQTSISLSKFDKLAISPRWGKLIAVLIILLGLVLSFIPGIPFMAVGMSVPSMISPIIQEALTSIGCPVFIIGIICDILINSAGFCLAMIGLIFGVTLVFGLLEEVGYLARISYVFDKTMSKIGLQGKSIMPFLMSFGCNIGGATGARVIDNWAQRVLTIALAWAVPCSATWAIVPTLSSIFFGIWAPVIIVVIFAVMLLHIYLTSRIIGHFLIKQEDRCGLIMELPPYHHPKWKNLFKFVLDRVKEIAFRMYKVVVLISFVFWLLTYSSGDPSNSILSQIGKVIEPITLFFGFTWETFLAFISSGISKEAALGVLNSLYTSSQNLYSATFNGAAVTSNLQELLQNAITKPQALAFIFAITFNTPCIMAIVSTYQESHSAKWTGIIAGYYIGLALLLAFIVYHVGLLIF